MSEFLLLPDKREVWQHLNSSSESKEFGHFTTITNGTYDYIPCLKSRSQLRSMMKIGKSIKHASECKVEQSIEILESSSRLGRGSKYLGKDRYECWMLAIHIEGKDWFFGIRMHGLDYYLSFNTREQARDFVESNKEEFRHHKAVWTVCVMVSIKAL